MVIRLLNSPNKQDLLSVSTVENLLEEISSS